MTKEEILEKSRKELQGRTISEESIRIRKEAFYLTEDQIEIRSFRWAYRCIMTAIIVLYLYKRYQGENAREMYMLMNVGIVGLAVSRSVFSRKRRDFILAGLLLSTFVTQIVMDFLR